MEEQTETKQNNKEKEKEDILTDCLKVHKRSEEQFSSIARLQKLLKQQFFHLSTEQEQKVSFEKKLHSSIFSYYRSTVTMGESTYQAIKLQSSRIQKKLSQGMQTINSSEKSEQYEQQRRLFQEEGFGDVYIFVKDVLLTMSKNPHLMMILIQKYQHSDQYFSLSSLMKAVVNSMYQNIVDADVFNKDLVKILTFCLRKVVGDNKHYYQIDFNEESLSHLLLSQFIERSEIKNYAKQVTKATLMEIVKIDHVIDFKKEENDGEKIMSEKTLKLTKKQSSRVQLEMPIKTNGYQGKPVDKKSKVSQYSESLRQYDEKMVRKGVPKRKRNKNCASEQLLNYLGINEQMNFPCFSCSSSEDMKMETEINKQLGLMMNMAQMKYQNDYHPDSLILKNIILVFFNDLFKMLYSMPALIRICCKVLYHYLIKRFNKRNCLYVIADFVINFWLMSALNLDLQEFFIEAAKLSPYLGQNTEEVIKIIKKIVKDNSKNINQGFLKQFQILVTNLKVSIANYIHEVLNIDGQRIDCICEEVQRCLGAKISEPCKQSVNAIKSYCVCMSMTDIKRLLQLIKGADKQLVPVNSKIVNRVQRIEMMSSGLNVFGDKKDKITGKLYKASKSYALFTDLALPQNLSIDYAKFYRDAFKNSKIKNLVKQVLISLADVESYQQFYTSNSMEDFIFSLYIRQAGETLHSIDSIPIRLKIEYLKILSRGVKMGQVINQLQSQGILRMKRFTEIWDVSKQYYLKAISSLNFQNSKLTTKENHIRSEIKRRKLEQFFNKCQIKLCLTSPKTREKQIVLKTTLMKQLIEEYRERLWLESQSNCIHKALNLDFIKSLTGEPERQKTKYECHFSNIKDFSEILCSLPEVRDRFSTTEDVLGIKDVFFDFIELIRNTIKSREQQYSILLQNLEWLQENIELKLSKKLYDKLYPKSPLYEDIAVYLRLKTLDWLEFEYLRIAPQLRNKNIWEVAAASLRTIDMMRTASEKLHCIEQTTKIIQNSYMLMSKNDRHVTADDFSPLMILVLIMAAPKRLISSINFIQSFASPSKLLSKQGYYLSQLKAALKFCDTMSAETMSMYQNQAMNYMQYTQRLYQKQIQYGIYFILGRRKDSPHSEKKKLEYLKEYLKKMQSS